MVDTISTLSSWQVTKNPFENGFEERTNYPDFSPSMFRKQDTPASEKKKRTFRWSIEQISRLNPADIDEFPNQDYSSTFEREEDEIEAQKAIDEYFSQNLIVPSPWTPDNPAKHVKFSPLPPATAYIEVESSVESYSSPNSLTCKPKADASSQTKLSLPPEFDLQKLLDPAFYGQESQEGSRDLSISSLRRKLFAQEEKRMKAEKDVLEPPSNIKSILKSPKSPILVTSSPVSVKVTPGQNARRYSSGSTVSSPNISPIKPLTVPETPTGTGRSQFAKLSMSPMHFSAHVLESSGIEARDVMFPDISPIKENDSSGSVDISGHVQEMDIDNGDSKENSNDSLADGGSLEVSALSVKDENDELLEGSDNDDDGDDEMPPKITMEDLADKSDLQEEGVKDEDGNSPAKKMKFVELTPREVQKPENPVNDPMKVNNKNGDARTKGTDLSSQSLPNAVGVKVEDVASNFSHDLVTESHRHKDWKLGKNDHSRYMYHGFSSRGVDYRTQKSYDKLGHFDELDGDLILMRAKAALKRADRYMSPRDTSLSFGPHSFSELNLNVSSQQWKPVGMSTPLLPSSSSPKKTTSVFDSGTRYGYKSSYGPIQWPGSSIRYNSAALTFGEESGLGRSAGEPGAHYFYGISGRKSSPVMEDLVRSRKHGISEGHHTRSNFWKQPISPSFSSRYPGRWRPSRTHPMTYLEWKALNWWPTREVEPWSSKNYRPYAETLQYVTENKRLSWPPSKSSTKFNYGSHPLSPPVFYPPAKVPRAVPGGRVTKIALPSYYDSSDSGYSDWQRSVSRWESAIKSQHSLAGNSAEFQNYY